MRWLQHCEKSRFHLKHVSNYRRTSPKSTRRIYTWIIRWSKMSSHVSYDLPWSVNFAWRNPLYHLQDNKLIIFVNKPLIVCSQLITITNIVRTPLIPGSRFSVYPLQSLIATWLFIVEQPHMILLMNNLFITLYQFCLINNWTCMNLTCNLMILPS